MLHVPEEQEEQYERNQSRIVLCSNHLPAYYLARPVRYLTILQLVGEVIMNGAAWWDP